MQAGDTFRLAGVADRHLWVVLSDPELDTKTIVARLHCMSYPLSFSYPFLVLSFSVLRPAVSPYPSTRPRTGSRRLRKPPRSPAIRYSSLSTNSAMSSMTLLTQDQNEVCSSRIVYPDDVHPSISTILET